jgi:cell shape-determining protein MreC
MHTACLASMSAYLWQYGAWRTRNRRFRKKLKELERDDHPTTEAQRLREENATLKAKLATTTKEKSEVTYERDVLLRKLNGVKAARLGSSGASSEPTLRRPDVS